MKTDWKKYTANPDPKYTNTSEAWNKLSSRIEEEGLLPEQNVSGNSWSYYLKIAAAIVLFTAISSVVAYFVVNNPAKGMEKFVAESGTMVVDLPDGSVVTLNQGSELSWHKSFALDRKLTLKGEGFFDVTHDPEHPFLINTEKAVITVLGTSFNVKETTDDEVEVLVETGVVRLKASVSQDNIVLNKGEFGKSDGLKARKTKPNELNYLSWKSLEFRFENTELPGILEELQKSYHVNIHYDRQALKDYKITTAYKDQSIDSIIQTISTAFNLEYSKKGSEFYLNVSGD